MNRRLAAAAGVAAVLLLASVVVVAGALGPAGPAGDADSPTDDTPEPTDTPTATDDPASTPTGTDEGTPTSTDDGTPTTEEAVEGTELAPAAETLVALPDQEIHGETPLAPGTELTVRLLSTNASQPFVRSGEATVDDDGVFAAAFDLHGVEPTDARLLVLHDGTELVNATVTVEAAEGEHTRSTATATAVSDHGTTLDHEGERVTLANDSGQVVSGSTDLEPGSELDVRIRSVSGDSPFLMQAETTVREDGTFRATFDLSEVESGTRFTVVVRHDGERIAEAEGEVVDSE